MNENIRSTNLRFNLEKEPQRQAWEYLQTMNKAQFKSYSQTVALALVDYFDRYYKSQVDPYFETWEREERFVFSDCNRRGNGNGKDLAGVFCRVYGWAVCYNAHAGISFTADNRREHGCRCGLGLSWRITYDGAKEVNT